MRPRRTTDRESGASLILVLVALTVFGLLVPVLGQFGSANGVSGYIVKGLRFDRYAADNGVQGAIAMAQTDRTMGRAYVPCPQITSNMNVGSTAFRRDVTVKCKGFTGSGKPVGDPVGDPSTPAYAVLALDPNGSHSIGIDSTGGLKTSGPWWANGDPGQTSADIHRVRIDATTDLFGATGNCNPAGSPPAQIFAAPLRCGKGDPNLPDPKYSSSVGTIGDVPVRSLAYDPVNGDPCSAIPPNGVLPLAPGYYWDGAGLDKIGQGRCGSVAIWLQPGKFYFDFDFYDKNASDRQWTIGSRQSNAKVVLVGGVPAGWSPSDSVDAIWNRVSTDNAATSGGACNSNLSGVEMVFGSSAHLAIAGDGRAEVCPSFGSSQRLAVVGRYSDERQPTQVTSNLFPRDAVPAGAQFDWPAAFEPNSLNGVDCRNNSPCDPTLFMEGTLTGRRNTGSVTMPIPNNLPVGARLDTLSMTIVHREPRSGDRAERDDSVAATLASPTPGIQCTGDLRMGDRWHSDAFTCTLDPRLGPVAASPDFSLRLDLRNGNGNGNNNGDADLQFQVDQVVVTGTTTAPSLRKAGGCVLSGRCDLLAVDGGSGNSGLFVWGMVYAPNGKVSENFGGRTNFAMKRGVAVKSLTLTNLPPVTGGAPFIPFSLPNGGIYSLRTVEFEAKVGSPGKTKLRARVEFIDPVVAPSTPPKITVWDTHP